MTVPGRRNNFYKSLEKEVSEFWESHCQRSTVGGDKKVRVSDFYWPHLKSKYSFFALPKLNAFSVVYTLFAQLFSPIIQDSVHILALQHTKVFPLTLKRP